MKTRALRLHGKNDLRLEECELPPRGEGEILADITTNSICMSTYKLAQQGQDHKRVPHDLVQQPIIVGHEFCGTLLDVGPRWSDRFCAGQKYSIQPALNLPGRELEAPGYSFPWIGGHASKVVIPAEVMEQDCLLIYEGEGYFNASLSEPVSCIIGAFNTSYHFRQGEYVHAPGIVDGGKCCVLAGAGPMGLGAIDYALHGPRRPALLVITDIDQSRLDRAADLFSPAHARELGVDLRYCNTATGNPVEDLRAVSGGGGYNDVFVFAPVVPLVEMASHIAGFNACINFFAGPSCRDFSAAVNFYDIHYSGHHIVGSSGGNTADMRSALALMAGGALNPAVMITHVGGIDSAAETILALPSIPGGKKLVYTQVKLPLTALADFEHLGEHDPFFAALARITDRHNGLWSLEAERYLLEHGNRFDS